jgi:hypothetical protein
VEGPLWLSEVHGMKGEDKKQGCAPSAMGPKQRELALGASIK